MDVNAILESWWWILLVALGIPSLLIRRIERKMDKQEADREKKEKAKEELLKNLAHCSMAAIALGEATAKAVQRIPDAHCNCDMHAALQYATKVKNDQKNFLTKMSVHALYDD